MQSCKQISCSSIFRLGAPFNKSCDDRLTIPNTSITDMGKDDAAKSATGDMHNRYRERDYYPYFKTMQTRWSDNDQYGIPRR